MEKLATDIQKHIDNIRTLGTDSGLFLASARSVATGYDKAWLRDNFYTSLAFEAVEDWDTVHRLWRAILNILTKHEYKIEWATKSKPYASWQYIHARYHPETFDEYWDEWGNKQNDAVGAILFKLGELEERGHGVIKSDADKRVIQRLVDYLGAVEYWQDPDSGMWEEHEEIHASSIGACLAGLEKVQALPYVTVPREYIVKGGAMLEKLLPRESATKFADLAMLSLVYPYRIVSPMMRDMIVENIEYHYARRHGVIRYKNDRYYNKNADGYSEEAEWTFGFPWLAIIYKEKGDWEKAHYYLAKAKNALTPDGAMPELYYSNSDMPNENIPLGWAESMLVVAMKEIGLP